MANVLRQSTQIVVRVGPFVDVTDGATPETGITLGAADQAEALKSAGAATVDISAATWAAVTGASGWYDLTLTTSHTDTVGELVIVVQDVSVCLPVFVRFQVLEEAVFDALYAGSAAGYQVPIWAAANSTVNLSATTIKTATDVETDTADIQSRLPAALVSGRIDASVGAIAANAITAASMAADASAEIADAVWDETLSGHLGAGSTGEALNAAGAAGDPWTTALPGAYGAGSAGKIIGDNINATISSRASQTSLDTVDDFLDTEIAAIKAKTDSLTFTTANRVDAQVFGVETGAITAGAIAADAIGASELAADAVAEIADAVWDEVKSGHTIAGTYGQHFGSATESATVNDASATTTSFVTTLASAVDDHYIGRVIIFTSGTLQNQATDITDYVGATKTVTVTALTSAPANGVAFLLI